MTDYIVSTAGIHPRDRFEYWFESSCQIWGRYENRPADATGFRGELRHLPVTGMALSVFGSNGMTTWRTQRQAARLPEAVYVFLQLGGNARIGQHGREAHLNAGDMTLIDAIEAGSFIHSPASTCMVAELSRRDCEARLGTLNRWTARRIDGASGAGLIASTFARLLPDQASKLSGPAQGQIALQLLDLVVLALKESEGDTVIHSSARLASLLRLKSVVETNLTNCNVTCEQLAAEAGISVRYANQLLDAEETSLQRLLFSQRIAKCQAALSDPAQMHRQITDVAYSWGFSDVSHFGRLFKAKTGLTPREFRRQSFAASQQR